jgi:hypothetical protein
MNYYDYYAKKYMPGKAEEPKDRKRFTSYLNLAVFTIVLTGFGLLSFILPKKEISELEKRKLAVMPSFSVSTMFEGTYMKDMDLYFADNFPMREGFVQMAFWMRDGRGFHSSDITLYLDDAVSDTSAAGDSLAVKKDSLALADSVGADTLADDADVNLANKGLMIVNNRALQIFGGSKKTAKRYTDMINTYKNTLDPDLHVFCIIAPSPTAFYLPSNHKELSNDEPANIHDIYSNLNASISTVDAYSEINAHKKEYLYFRTDHHWTGRGAYYAYRAFCKTSGFTPLELDSMQQKTIPNFLGTLYSKTRDKTLKDSIDHVDYWIIPGAHKCWYWTKKNQKKLVSTTLLAEHAKGENAYGVFLGSDYPMMKIQTGIKNGRRAVIIKNSFGNAFAPFVTAHYEEVYVIDYRYFKQGLSAFMKENKITDLIFISDTFLANADSHQKKMKKILK